MSEILKMPWLQNWSDWRGRQHRHKHPRAATAYHIWLCSRKCHCIMHSCWFFYSFWGL